MKGLIFGMALCLFSLAPAQAQTVFKPDVANYNATNITGKDFSGKKMIRGSFVKTTMRNMKLKGADMSKSVLSGADATGSDLTDVNLRGALLDRVKFINAKLTNVNLSLTTATGTVFTGSDITGADFTDAIIDSSEVSALCKRAKGVNPVTKVDTRKSLGCR